VMGEISPTMKAAAPPAARKQPPARKKSEDPKPQITDTNSPKTNRLPAEQKQPPTKPANNDDMLDDEARLRVPNLASPPKTNAEAKAGEWILIGIGGLCLVLFTAWIAQSRARKQAALPRLIPETSSIDSSYTLISSKSISGSDAILPAPLVHVGQGGRTHSEALHAGINGPLHGSHEELRAGLVAHMSLWLKQRFVRRLLTDREDMLGAQQVATSKALEAEHAIDRIEARIQEQNQLYQTRIEALTRELQAAREGNRELIRARINDTRAELETARARILAENQPEKSPTVIRGNRGAAHS
jgi:hypothetical protein